MVRKARELVLELGDRALVERLRFFGGVILRVLGQVTVRTRVGDLLDDAGALDLLAVLELLLEHGIARGRHWKLVHSSVWPPNLVTDKIRIAGRMPPAARSRNVSQTRTAYRPTPGDPVSALSPK